jgi:hypothetical protein
MGNILCRSSKICIVSKVPKFYTMTNNTSQYITPEVFGATKYHDIFFGDQLCQYKFLLHINAVKCL